MDRTGIGDNAMLLTCYIGVHLISQLSIIPCDLSAVFTDRQKLGIPVQLNIEYLFVSNDRVCNMDRIQLFVMGLRSMFLSGVRSGRGMAELTSTQCSISIGAFLLPTHVNVSRARNGLSVVLVATKGGSMTTIGSIRVEGGGSVRQVTVSFSKKDVMWILCIQYVLAGWAQLSE